MKKLLFVLAFTFIGQQVFSQIYILTLSDGCAADEIQLTKYPPTGGVIQFCISEEIEAGLVSLNQELNSIINQGYKLIETNNGQATGLHNNGLINEETINKGTTFYFAIP